MHLLLGNIESFKGSGLPHFVVKMKFIINAELINGSPLLFNSRMILGPVKGSASTVDVIHVTTSKCGCANYSPGIQIKFITSDEGIIYSVSVCSATSVFAHIANHTHPQRVHLGICLIYLVNVRNKGLI